MGAFIGECVRDANMLATWLGVVGAYGKKYAFADNQFSLIVWFGTFLKVLFLMECKSTISTTIR